MHGSVIVSFGCCCPREYEMIYGGLGFLAVTKEDEKERDTTCWHTVALFYFSFFTVYIPSVHGSVIVFFGCCYHREYEMSYRGPGFLAVVWFGISPTPIPSLPSVSTTSITQEDWERERQLAAGRGGETGVSKEPNHTITRKLGPL